MKVIATNRKAYHDYEILESVEAGIVLTGTEIKSLRQGRASIREAYARVDEGELWLIGAHIPPYGQGGIYNHEPTRIRKLLLHREQLVHFTSSSSQKGFTIIPLRIYIKKRVAKIELGLVRGRRQYDKRRVIAQRDADREMRRAIKARIGAF